VRVVDLKSEGAWYVGNAVRDDERHRGWIVGHFMNGDDDVRQSEGVEIKWGIHARGMNEPSGRMTRVAPRCCCS
jgi:hypothetical protein